MIGNGDATSAGQQVAAAVCAKCQVRANSKSQVEFSLTWDQPVIHFGSRQQLYKR